MLLAAAASGCAPSAGPAVGEAKAAIGAVAGVKPLVTILTSLPPPPGETLPPFDHDIAFYHTLLFGQQTPNLQAYFREISRNQFTFSDAGVFGPVPAHWFKGQADLDRLRDSISLLEVAGFDFAAYDTNNDNRVTDDELAILIVDNGSTNGGMKRGPVCVALAFTPGVQVCIQGAFVGVDTPFWTAAHELSHTIGTHDLYAEDCFSDHLTLMSCEPGASDDRTIIYPDAWHRAKLGWMNVVTPSGNAYELGDESFRRSNGGFSQPAAFYRDLPGSNEYFLFEYRDRRGYDLNVGDQGIVAWHIKENGSGDVYKGSDGKETEGHAIYAVGPDRAYAARQAWKPEDGRFQLAWKDGTTLPYSFWVEQRGNFNSEILHWDAAPANNRPPTVQIVRPANGASGPYGFGAPVTFEARVTDSRGSTGGTSVVWSSDVDGTLGSGATVSYAFTTPGPRTITATGKDQYGAVASATITFTALAVGPSVHIDAPTAGATFFLNQPIQLSGGASTPVQLALPCDRLTWTVDQLPHWWRTGCAGSVSLPALGPAVFTLTAQDDLGQTASTSVRVNVVMMPNQSPVVAIMSPTAGLRLANWNTYHVSGSVRSPWSSTVSYRWTAYDVDARQEKLLSIRESFEWRPDQQFPFGATIELRLYGTDPQGTTTMAKQSHIIIAPPH